MTDHKPSTEADQKFEEWFDDRVYLVGNPEFTIIKGIAKQAWLACSADADLARPVALREAAKISASESRVWESSALPPQQRIAAKILSLLTQSAADALAAYVDEKVAEAVLGEKADHPEELRYCSECNLRRYFKNEKCEVCANRVKVKGGSHADFIRAAKEEMRTRAAAVCGAHTHANLILALPLDPPEPEEQLPCPVCGNEVRHPGTGLLNCECPAPDAGKEKP